MCIKTRWTGVGDNVTLYELNTQDKKDQQKYLAGAMCSLNSTSLTAIKNHGKNTLRAYTVRKY